MNTDNRMTVGNVGKILKEGVITASAPCRIDFGGTLDIGSFHYPLRRLEPCTVNIALDRRTTITLAATRDDGVRIASTGIAEARFAAGGAPYDHPLGLMFAIADYFGAAGVSIRIQSSSPPQSGLGGSSVAAVALINAFAKLLQCAGRTGLTREQMVLIGHAVEQGTAGALCGLQDHLAAAFGGVNAWTWTADPARPPFSGRPLLKATSLPQLDRCLLVAYLGVTHVSKDVNGTWVRQFIGARHREQWRTIVHLTQRFARAIEQMDMAAAAAAMNEETAIRKAMTPGVLDALGDRLAADAVDTGCGARFTGAGGGGCLWAVGTPDAVAALKPVWVRHLAERPTAGLIECRIDPKGVD